MQLIQEMLRQHIADNILFSTNGYPYPDDASFLENGIIDSMNVMELVLFLEEKWGIKIEDTEIVPENFDSVSGLAGFVRSKQLLSVSAPGE
ncbi:MAG TPA: acyl carrier protein [Cyanobacteria bacterium UBA8803]|nr:acyl carrier protein [Cyanobacteria bacterium UBA9273]HBL58881.1 acyl carrier protein [Cyanobacteria bacterium UBA8803]